MQSEILTAAWTSLATPTANRATADIAAFRQLRPTPDLQPADSPQAERSMGLRGRIGRTSRGATLMTSDQPAQTPTHVASRCPIAAPQIVRDPLEVRGQPPTSTETTR